MLSLASKWTCLTVYLWYYHKPVKECRRKLSLWVQIQEKIVLNIIVQRRKEWKCVKINYITQWYNFLCFLDNWRTLRLVQCEKYTHFNFILKLFIQDKLFPCFYLNSFKQFFAFIRNYMSIEGNRCMVLVVFCFDMYIKRVGNGRAHNDPCRLTGCVL